MKRIADVFVLKCLLVVGVGWLVGSFAVDLLISTSEELTLHTEADTLLSGAFVADDITIPETMVPGTVTYNWALDWSHYLDAPLVVGRRTPDGDTIKAAFLSAEGDTLAMLIITRNVFIIR